MIAPVGVLELLAAPPPAAPARPFPRRRGRAAATSAARRSERNAIFFSVSPLRANSALTRSISGMAEPPADRRGCAPANRRGPFAEQHDPPVQPLGRQARGWPWRMISARASTNCSGNCVLAAIRSAAMPLVSSSTLLCSIVLADALAFLALRPRGRTGRPGPWSRRGRSTFHPPASLGSTRMTVRRPGGRPARGRRW